MSIRRRLIYTTIALAAGAACWPVTHFLSHRNDDIAIWSEKSVYSPHDIPVFYIKNRKSQTLDVVCSGEAYVLVPEEQGGGSAWRECTMNIENTATPAVYAIDPEAGQGDVHHEIPPGQTMRVEWKDWLTVDSYHAKALFRVHVRVWAAHQPSYEPDSSYDSDAFEFRS